MKLKPLTSGQKNILRMMANILVCQNMESKVIKPQFEKVTGKPYDAGSKDSFVNHFLAANPDHNRVWKRLQKEMNTVWGDQLAKAKAESEPLSLSERLETANKIITHKKWLIGLAKDEHESTIARAEAAEEQLGALERDTDE